MKSLISAIGFLTIIPVGNKEINKKTVAFFPVCGLFLGVLIYFFNFFLQKIFPQNITNAFILLIYTILTGGLHLDGLADTFDAISGARGDKKRFFEILDDSNIGTAGTIALIFSVVLKFLLLTENALLIFPLLSRWGMVFSMFISKPAKDDGLGSLFIKNTTFGSFMFSTIFTILATFLFLKWNGVIFILILATFVSLMSFYFTKKIGGVTGDILGAINELSEVLCLVLINF
ncbi:MAG: adenosylcobinamide-GDP ribazoletransferase [Endomicrobiia bacterium]